MIILQASKRLHRSHSNRKHQTQRFSDFVEQTRSAQYKRTSRAERKTAEKVETGDRKANKVNCRENERRPGYRERLNRAT